MHYKVLTVVATLLRMEINGELCGFLDSKGPNGGLDREWSEMQRRNLESMGQINLKPIDFNEN